jgi:hypothetical protein
MYTENNYLTKKALKAAVKSGEQVRVCQPGPFEGKTDGVVGLEGPHYPRAHSWYAEVEIKDSAIVKVIG